MKKIETIWHHLLWSALEKGEYRQTQQELAGWFSYSLSTVNLAVKQAAVSGAIEVRGKFFVLRDVRKLLYYWATRRNLVKDIIFQTYVDEPIEEIEGLLPAEAILTGYTAAKQILAEPPADYSQVYFYFDEDKLEVVKKRFPAAKAEPNLFVLKAYPKQITYGSVATLPQMFVDLWNLSAWYAQEFTNVLELKINGLLS